MPNVVACSLITLFINKNRDRPLDSSTVQYLLDRGHGHLLPCVYVVTAQVSLDKELVTQISDHRLHR